jgi:hypothetical protein
MIIDISTCHVPLVLYVCTQNSETSKDTPMLALLATLVQACINLVIS